MEKFYRIGDCDTESIVEWLRSETWSGARDRCADASEETLEAVAYRIAECYGDRDYISETALNDLVWFECDDLFYPEENDDEEDEESEEAGE